MQEMQLKSVEMGCFRASKIAKVSTQNQHQLPQFTWAISRTNDLHFYSSKKFVQYSQCSFVEI